MRTLKTVIKLGLLLLIPCSFIGCVKKKNIYNQYSFDSKELKLFEGCNNEVTLDSLNSYGLTLKPLNSNLPSDTFMFNFPINNEIELINGDLQTKTILTTRLDLNGVNLQLHFYYINDNTSLDEELLVVYSDMLGIVRIQNIHWGNRLSLYQSEILNNESLMFLQDRVNDYMQHDSVKEYF